MMNQTAAAEECAEEMAKKQGMGVERMKDYDLLMKFLLIGDSGVGKTSLLTKFADNNFTINCISTIGVDFRVRRLLVDETTIKLQIWDTAGQEKYRSIVNSYYRGSAGVIVVFDIGDRDSFDHVRHWFNEIDSYETGLTRVLVGNKADCPDRKVTPGEAAEYARRIGVDYYEASAKNGWNVEEVFATLARRALQKLRAEAPNGSAPGDKTRKSIKYSLRRNNKRKTTNSNSTKKSTKTSCTLL